MLPLSTMISMAKFFAPGLKLEESGPFLELSAKYGQPAEFSMPIEILSLGLKMFSRGLYTALVYQTRTDWKWPYWLRRQSDVKDSTHQSVAHSIIVQNRVHRNWTILGLPFRNERLIVDPVMMITPFRDGYSIECWIETSNGIQELFTDAYTSTIIGGNQTISDRYPMIRQTVEIENNLSIRQNIFAGSVSGQDMGFTRVKIKNISQRDQSVKIWFAIRPYNPEGISPIHHLEFSKETQRLTINNQTAIFFQSQPNIVKMGNAEFGDSWNKIKSKTQQLKIHCPDGLSNGAIGYTLSISTAEIINLDLVFSLKKENSEEKIDWTHTQLFNYERAKSRMQYSWSKSSNETMQIYLPDHRLTHLTKLCLNYQQIFAQSETTTPGYFIYNDFWYRDSAYLLFGLLKSGHFENVRSILETYPNKQQPDGFFESQEGEWDSNGAALWIVGQYFHFTQDKDLILDLWPSLMKGARWIAKKRGMTKKDKSVSGLLPAGFSAEHFGANDYYFWDNFWSLSGLLELEYLAEKIKKLPDLKWIQSERKRYQQDIHLFVSNSLDANKGILSASPKRTPDAGSIGNMCADYPLQIAHLFPDFIENEKKYLLETFGVKNCFYQQIVHTGLNMYLTLHLRHPEIITHDETFWSSLHAVAEKASATGTWPEGIHPISGGGVMGEGHHGWANVEWISSIRDALVLERGDELWITPVFNSQWLKNPDYLSVKHAFTTFGMVEFELSWNKEKMILNIQQLFHRSPKKIRWFLPKGVEFAEKVIFQNNIQEIELPIEKNQVIELTFKKGSVKDASVPLKTAMTHS